MIVFKSGKDRTEKETFLKRKRDLFIKENNIKIPKYMVDLYFNELRLMGKAPSEKDALIKKIAEAKGLI